MDQAYHQDHNAQRKRNEKLSLEIEAKEGRIVELEIKITQAEDTAKQALEDLGTEQVKEVLQEVQIRELKEEEAREREALELLKKEEAREHQELEILKRENKELRLKVESLERENKIQDSRFKMESLERENKDILEIQKELNEAKKEVDELKVSNEALMRT